MSEPRGWGTRHLIELTNREQPTINEVRVALDLLPFPPEVGNLPLLGEVPVRLTGIHDRAVAALAAWLNGGEHQVASHLFYAADAALRLLNRDELMSLGVELEASDEAGRAAPSWRRP